MIQPCHALLNQELLVRLGVRIGLGLRFRVGVRLRGMGLGVRVRLILHLTQLLLLNCLLHQLLSKMIAIYA